jgi:hypothetical protein
MELILVDRIDAVVFHNGVLRVDCVAIGPNNKERASGTLLIPASQAGTILRTLIGATQELERRLREQAMVKNASTPGSGNGEPS